MVKPHLPQEICESNAHQFASAESSGRDRALAETETCSHKKINSNHIIRVLHSELKTVREKCRLLNI